MCGISGIFSLKEQEIADIHHKVEVMNSIIAHRGPDGEGVWVDERNVVGLGHRRLSIIDLSNTASQPMSGENGTVICFNGEIYNYIELKEQLKNHWDFQTHSDTETILAAYNQYGPDSIQYLRGMFAFALWDNKKQKLFCARDRFGIKPFYYAIIGNHFFFASEAKALLPFLPTIETDPKALSEYLTFQYTLGDQTLFKGISQLLPGHALTASNGQVRVWKYWDVNYEINYDKDETYFSRTLSELLDDSIKVHLRSDVQVASYLSGGVDSSLVTVLASEKQGGLAGAFHGRMTEYSGYDESNFARSIADQTQQAFYCTDITSQDFRDNIAKVIYHLDFPVAGPGSFPQFMVSKLASQHVKVVLGGQGGDELFGGYARYLIGYLEQSLKHSIMANPSIPPLDISFASLIPSLGMLKEYVPTLKECWREGLFGDLDLRYFRLCDRSNDMIDKIDWSQLNKQESLSTFKEIFNRDNIPQNSFFNRMLHFDFKCLLPALLHVEDRMSMAHGLESRVPLLDHPLVEFLATIPEPIKFKNGQMKYLLKQTFGKLLPDQVLHRRDKMGFPVPLNEWFSKDLNSFVNDTFAVCKTRNRPYMNVENVLKNVSFTHSFSRKTWGLFSLELWFQQFHDRQAEYKKLADVPELSKLKFNYC